MPNEKLARTDASISTRIVHIVQLPTSHPAWNLWVLDALAVALIGAPITALCLMLGPQFDWAGILAASAGGLWVGRRT